MASVGSSQDPPETGNRRARAAIGAPAEPAGRGFLARRGWFKDSRAVGSRRRTASCSLKRIWRAAPYAIRILRSKSPSFLQKTSHSQQSPISRPLARSQRAIAHFGRILAGPRACWISPALASARIRRLSSLGGARLVGSSLEDPDMALLHFGCRRCGRRSALLTWCGLAVAPPWLSAGGGLVEFCDELLGAASDVVSCRAYLFDGSFFGVG